MEAAVGAVNWLVGKVVTKLSDDVVAAYVASLDLGHNFKAIQRKLLKTQGLLHAAQTKDVSDNHGLQELLRQLSRKADEAEDALDELHYFKIQDQLDGTDEATTQEPAQEIGDVIRAHARHTRHTRRYTVGNCLRCFSCSPIQDDDCGTAHVANNPDNTTQSDNDNNGGHVDKLSFNRVAMSNKIKSVIEDIHSLCIDVSDVLGQIPNNNTTVPLTRPQRGAIVQDKLYGREIIFKKTVDDITNCGETLSVLPIVGPGGIGKTTFTQHLYNHARTEENFTVRVWVCVSTSFDVLELTKQILSCIPATEKEGSNNVNETSNLSELQKHIAQRLKSKRFLIVLDDIWKCESKEDWKTLLAPFTKGDTKGNMVVVTTRFPKLANMMETTNPIELQGLEPTDFFTFFEACIFGEHRKPRHYKDDLIGIAGEIANKLKGSPLAAKTVGRLLRKNLSWEHWNGVLQKREWLNQQNNDDIMPSLKISYDYLPFKLQKCFLYCALFPEDYMFNGLEIYRFWIAIGIIESVDRNYLEELVNNGFLMKGGDDCDQYYVMHDLMHELCRCVSAQDCLNISNLDFRAESIEPSIRHLSITIPYRFHNKFGDEKFGEEMGKLKGRIDIANLRTLMIFGFYEERISEILRDTFEDINGLRVLFIFVNSLESLPRSFSKLIHLQYLQIRSGYSDGEMALPSTLSRFYHLKFLDLENWHGSCSLPKDFSRLVNLRDLIANKELHSNVPEVGKMKYLQELKKFCVKKERVGFELSELGELTELGGTLSIHNLENVATKEEASDAKLMLKRNLKELRLVWDKEQPTINADVLDGLQPHPNLRALVIENPSGTTGPSWLCIDICVKSLETLRLECVSWGTLPPLGLLPHLKKIILRGISGVRRFGPDFGGVTGRSFLHLNEIVFDNMPELVDWTVESNCNLFSRLERIECSGCPNLSALPFSECSFTNLCSLYIRDCPKLSLPPIPHTSKLTYFDVRRTGSEHFSYDGRSLRVYGYDRCALAFHNLHKVEHVGISNASDISLKDLERFKSLISLCVERCDSMFSEEVDGSVVFHSVESLSLSGSHFTRKSLSKMLNCFPALSYFKMDECSVDHEERVMEFPSSSSLREVDGSVVFRSVESLSLRGSHFTRKSLSKMLNCFPALSYFEMASCSEDRVIEFPLSSSLREVAFRGCKGLVLVPAEDGGEIQRGISSLQSLRISGCGKLFSRWPMAIKPFPASLRELVIDGESSLQSMALLSNLTSLTHLTLENCENLTMDWFDPLMAANLKELMVNNYKEDENSPYSIAADLLSEVSRSITRMPAGSFQLERLEVDSISGVLVGPICNLLAATLHTLLFYNDNRTESFTEEQEKALQLLTSLQELDFACCKGLQSLPQGLHRLSSLRGLHVDSCEKLRCLPKDGFPTSLQKLTVWSCSAELKDQVEELKARNPNLRVDYR